MSICDKSSADRQAEDPHPACVQVSITLSVMRIFVAMPTTAVLVAMPTTAAHQTGRAQLLCAIALL